MPYKDKETVKAFAQKNKDKYNANRREKLKLIKQDPIRLAEFREKERELFNKRKDIKNKQARERLVKLKKEDPDKYVKYREKKSKQIKNHKDNNKEYYRVQRKKWIENNKERYKAILKKGAIKAKSNVPHTLRATMSTMIYSAFKRGGAVKKGSILDNLPYTMLELKKHLELQFEPWMTWENRGKFNPEMHDQNPTWQIDHIIPQSFFNFYSYTDKNFKMCWSLKNIRPLDSKLNILKKDKIENPGLISILEKEQEDLEKSKNGDANEV